MSLGWLCAALALTGASWWPGCAAAEPATLEVLHWWQTDSDRLGLRTLEEAASAEGLLWKNAYSRPDVMARYQQLLLQATTGLMRPAVSAALVPGYGIHLLAQRQLLLPLDELAEQERWAEVLPLALQQQMRYQGHWVAAALSAHSYNSLWLNTQVLEKLSLAKPPETWADLLAMLEAARRRGIAGLAMSQHPWEPLLLFELVAIGKLGIHPFRQGFEAEDPQVLTEAALQTLFQRMADLRPYIASGYEQRSLSQSTRLVAEGQALMQVGGNWLEGTLRPLTAQRGAGLACWRFPDTQGMVLFSGDYFVFPRAPGQTDEALSGAQRRLASLLMRPDLQSAINRSSGGPPARVDAQRQGLTECGHQALVGMRLANNRNALQSSLFVGMNNPTAFRLQLAQVIKAHFQGQISSAQAAQQLAASLSRPASKP